MKKLSFIFITILLFFVVSCGGNEPQETVKKDYDMSRISFEDMVVTYDGEEHEITISESLPEGVTVSYRNNKLTDVGSIEATAIFSHNNPDYNEIPSMTATLTIIEAEIGGISLISETHIYDGEEKSLEIFGFLPEEFVVSYENNNQVDAGEYEVKAIIEDTNGNYETLTLVATLTIMKADYSTIYDMSSVYFEDKTVLYDGSEQNISITGELPEGVTVSYSNNTLNEAGSITATASFAHNNPNYTDIPDMTASLTVELYIRVDEDNNIKDNGNYILFGFYPQTKVIDDILISQLTDLVGPKPTEYYAYGFTSYEYYVSSSKADFMWYKDIDLDSDGMYDYRCVYFSEYRPLYSDSSFRTEKYSYQYNNGYYTGNYYFFEYEPIKWKIIKEDNVNVTLMADLIIDSQEYCTATETRYIEGYKVDPNNYEYSNIREWLNDDFYNMVFDTLQQSIINVVNVDNSLASTTQISNIHVCNDTKDKVWLMSAKEVSDLYLIEGIAAMSKYATDYAACQGVALIRYSDETIDKIVEWWARSPHFNGISSPQIVRTFHYAYFGAEASNSTSKGIVPSISINL